MAITACYVMLDDGQRTDERRLRNIRRYPVLGGQIVEPRRARRAGGDPTSLVGEEPTWLWPT